MKTAKSSGSSRDRPSAESERESNGNIKKAVKLPKKAGGISDQSSRGDVLWVQ